MIDISIIVLSYNTQALTLQCLKSVQEACKAVSAEVFVVDNASSDGSVEQIQKRFPFVKIICNKENLGYARANNQAIKASIGGIKLLLNSDTKLYADALQQIIEGFDYLPNIGVVGPLLLNDDHSIQPSYGKFTSVTTEFLFQSFLFKLIPTSFVVGNTIHPIQKKNYQAPHSVDWITGACFAIRSDVIDKVGLLPEDLFMYGEDIEWCWRVRESGFQVLHWPQANVFHYSRQSSRKNYTRWIDNYTNGQLIFALKHLNPVQTRFIGLLTSAGALFRVFLWAVIRLLQPKRKLECDQRIEGYVKAYRLGIKVFISGRLN